MDQIVHQIPRSRNPGFAGEMKPVAMALGLAFGLGVGTMPIASAATLTVLNNADTGAGSLRATVTGAAPGDVIVFGSVTGVIPLATQITISKDVTISGPGAGSLTIAPSSTHRAIFIDSNNPTVTISGVTFQGNGTAVDDGAAIYNYGGALTILNTVFSGNVTTGKGGAIYNYVGDVVIKSSTFSGNRATGLGGAIYNYGGSVSIDASTFSGNQSASGGGAIAFYADTGTPSSSLTITNSTLSGNQTTGVNKYGGAIYLHNVAASTITNSTISGNSASGTGGAIALYRTILAVNNSTITGNTATSSVGGVYLYGSTLNLFSTIVANNVGGGSPDIGVGETGTVNGTNSLVRSTSGFTFSTNVNNITGLDPLLGPLASNGGPTQTMALLPGSPAIDKGINPLALAFDQRGTPFVRSSGVTDIGAYEVQGAPPPPPVASVPVPTLSQWGLALLSAMMAGWAMLTGFGKRRRS